MRSLRLGFTAIEMMLVVLVIGILTAIAVPNFLNARTTARRDTCVSNLHKIDQAKEQWAMETHAAQGATVSMAVLTSGYLKGSVYCPAGGAYSVQPVGTNPTCTIADHIEP